MKKTYLLALIVLIHPAINLSLGVKNIVNAPLPPKFKNQGFVLQDDAKQQILAHNLWDKKRGVIVSDTLKKDGEKQKKMANWTLKAVKNAEFAMIDVDGKLKKYYPDDELPNQIRLKKILFDGIVVQGQEEEDEEKTIYLFGKKTASKKKEEDNL